MPQGAAPRPLPRGLVPGDIFFGHAPFGTNGQSPASAYTYTAGRSSVFNFNAFSESLPESTRYGGYLAGDHKIYGDQMVGYADMFYQNVKTHNELAPAATGSFETAGSGDDLHPATIIRSNDRWCLVVRL